MKINLALIASIIAAVGLVAIAFTAFQIANEREQLRSELEAKTTSIAEDFYKAHIEVLQDTGMHQKINITDSMLNQYRFTGLAIYFNQDSIEFINEAVKPLLASSMDYISQAISADSSMGKFVKINGNKYFEYIKLIEKTDLPASAVIFFTDADYIDNILNSIWFRNFWRWFFQALVISVVTLLIVRWGILSPIKKVIEWVRAARLGNFELLQTRPRVAFLEPLFK